MYYLGIDGGGTKTKACIKDANGRVIYKGVSGPSSIDTVSLSDSMKVIQGTYKTFMDEHKEAYFQRICIGLGGIVSKEDKAKVRTFAKSLPGITSKTKIDIKNDMEIALGSGLLFEEGIVLICGTGSVAYGKSISGLNHKSGGWGFKEGDLGSSYDLGLKALKHVIRAYDGRDDVTLFSKAVAKHIKFKTASDYIDILDKRYLDRTWIASLAPLVTKYALKNDQNALSIIERAVFDLTDLISAVYKKLEDKPYRIVIVGSLGHAKGFKSVLYQKILDRFPKLSIVEPLIEPCEAAAMLATKQLNPIND